jgi:hypothetical protein
MDDQKGQTENSSPMAFPWTKAEMIYWRSMGLRTFRSLLV